MSEGMQIIYGIYSSGIGTGIAIGILCVFVFAWIYATTMANRYWNFIVSKRLCNDYEDWNKKRKEFND